MQWMVLVSQVLEAMEALVHGILRQFGVEAGERVMLDSSGAIKKVGAKQKHTGCAARRRRALGEEGQRSVHASPRKMRAGESWPTLHSVDQLCALSTLRVSWCC